MLIVVDVGGTKTAIAEYSSDLKKLKVIRTPRNGELLSKLEEEISRLNPSEVSIATMGPISLSEGKIFNNPHIKEELPIGSYLTEKLGVPVYIVNDCSAGAWAEARVRNEENLVYVGFGTGVGVGAVVDGNLLLGKDGNAHEFGHVKVDLSGKLPCGCGGRGHVESYLGGDNLPSFAKLLGYEVDHGSSFFALLRSNERAFAEFKNVLRAFLTSLANAYDPEVIVLGGGVYFKNIDVFEKALKGFEKDKDLIVRAPRIESARFNDEAPLYGAAFLAIDKPEKWMRKMGYLKGMNSQKST